MYDELIKKIRHCATDPMHCLSCVEDKDGRCFARLMTQGADAIEALSKLALDEHNRAAVAAWENRWIPVTERLPEENGRYLVRYKRDIVLDYTEVHDDEVRIMKFFVGDGWRYPFLCQPELRKAEQQTVTHWMPLPEPPKEDEP